MTNHPHTAQLEATAKLMVAPGKGILAADESTRSIEKRFASINLPSTIENRQAYRELLLTTAGMGEYISGVILFDETFRQTTKDGKLFTEVLAEHGVLPGIKVDTGTVNLPGSEEKTTEGLDQLRERLAEYAKLGARFAKWRATYDITADKPSERAIHVNNERLALYAVLCQEVGIVPMVEPEVLMDGTHDLPRCAQVTEQVLTDLFEELSYHGALLSGLILKPNMVTAGSEASTQASVEEVAKATVVVLTKTVPATVPGITFLSGGQSDVLATEHLNAMNTLGPHPWALSFSYGRALQGPVLRAWQGRAENVSAAQAMFLHRAKMNALATRGSYTAEAEQNGPALS